MRVLFITSNYLSGGAVSNCLNNIFGQLTEEFEIDVACMSKSETHTSDLPIKAYKINSVHTTSVHDRSSAYKKTELYALKVISNLKILPYKLKYKIEHARSYKETEEIVKNNNYDVLISVCAMFSNHYIAYRLKKKYPNLKWIAYYFDPFSFNKVETTSFKSRLNFENKLLEYADGIVLTEQMKREFLSCVLKRHLKKSIVCEFPNIVNRNTNEKNSTIEFNKEKINCVFTGYIYSLKFRFSN